jgi:hypothetical protein
MTDGRNSNLHLPISSFGAGLLGANIFPRYLSLDGVPRLTMLSGGGRHFSWL